MVQQQESVQQYISNRLSCRNDLPETFFECRCNIFDRDFCILSLLFFVFFPDVRDRFVTTANNTNDEIGKQHGHNHTVTDEITQCLRRFTRVQGSLQNIVLTRTTRTTRTKRTTTKVKRRCATITKRDKRRQHQVVHLPKLRRQTIETM